MIHELKTWPDVFIAILEGRKCHEYRVDDRDFQLHDTLVLREWTPGVDDGGRYTGRVIKTIVTYIDKSPRWGIADGYAAMTIRVLGYDHHKVSV